ncbi:2-C-methyl-D-erythritol 2,4-cyclodiphosphate synthase [Brucella anthropi]
MAPERCNVKAKTNEKLGFEGKEEGIVAQAIVLLYRAEGADQD